MTPPDDDLSPEDLARVTPEQLAEAMRVLEICRKLPPEQVAELLKQYLETP